MSKDFEQLSIQPGYMKHNDGLLFREISKHEYEFKTTIKDKHLNTAGITHGGYIASIIDAGAGTGAHRAADNFPCVTISLDIKFIAATKLGDEIVGFTKIQRKTKSMVFLICHLKSKSKMVASASGVWKILNIKPSSLGPGG
jgi:acyl-coenzyme A thioesterase PaaI-like protein